MIKSTEIYNKNKNKNESFQLVNQRIGSRVDSVEFGPEPNRPALPNGPVTNHIPVTRPDKNSARPGPEDIRPCCYLLEIARKIKSLCSLADCHNCGSRVVAYAYGKRVNLLNQYNIHIWGMLIICFFSVYYIHRMHV